MKKTIKWILLCIFLITRATNAFAVDKEILYKSALNGAAGGAVVGLVTPTNSSSFFLFTLLTSPLYHTIPIALGLLTAIKTLKKQKYAIFGFRGYLAPIIDLLNPRTVLAIIRIGGSSFLITILSYHVTLDCIGCLKQKIAHFYNKLRQKHGKGPSLPR